MAASGGTVTATVPTEGQPRGQHPKAMELIPKSVTDQIKKDMFGRGVLIPLKTVAEVTQEHTVIHVYITRVPQKCVQTAIECVA